MLKERLSEQIKDIKEKGFNDIWLTKKLYSGRKIFKNDILLHAFLRVNGELKVIDLVYDECDTLYVVDREDFEYPDCVLPVVRKV
jgi:hypothetical protein